MSDKYFIDTNILIYSFDETALEKQKVAQQIIQNALTNGSGVISSQVIQEFFNVAIRKFSSPMSLEDCSNYLHSVLIPLCQVFTSAKLYENTLNIMKTYNYTLYDSLIITAALEANCTILYSEDLQHNQKIGKLKIINPFKEMTDLSAQANALPKVSTKPRKA